MIAWRRALGLIALLSIFFVQAAAASPHNSVTFDEPYHITLGYAYLKTGDLRLHRNQSPPLFELIASLPLLLRSDLALPLDHPAYALWGDAYLFSDAFMWHANSAAQGIVHSGRLVAAGFGALLGLLLFAWGRQLYGEKAGWLAAGLLVFDPNFIANAIPTLDLGLAFFVTFAVWRLWRCLKRPTRLNILFAGLALGAALSTKFVAMLLLPAFALILFVHPEHDERRRTAFVLRLPGRALTFAMMLAAAWAVTWAIYGFQFGPIGGAGLPVPAPLYVESFIGKLLKTSEGRMNFLSGQLSLTGWPHYFLVALLIKTPAPVLIVALGALLRWPWRREWREVSILIVPAALLFAAASISRLQLGYRYILPALPFLYLIAARSVTLAWPRWITIPLAVLAAWLVVGTLSIFPHYLSYFNELAGGPAAGHRHLVDSNLDWGQDLPALKEWIDRVGGDGVVGDDYHREPSASVPSAALRGSSRDAFYKRLHLGFFGTAYFERYGIQAVGIPSYPLNAYGHEVDGFTSYSLEPGLYAISATLLRIGLVSKQFNIYEAFQSMTPIDQAGYSILIYDVRYPPGADVDRAVIVGPLASDVPADALGAQPGHPLRAKWCAWPECFVFTPHPARYIIRDFIPFAPDLAAQARAQATTLDTRRVGADEYAVISLDATAIIESKLGVLHSASFAAPDQTPLTPPIPFANGLSLVGYEVRGDRIAPGQSLDVLTYWQVHDRIAPPMAIFVHVLDPQGNIRGQHDGFGAALAMLEPGDVVIQHHRITLDASAEPGLHRLQVGLYHPNTLERFAAHPPDAPPLDRILLSTLEVGTP